MSVHKEFYNNKHFEKYLKTFFPLPPDLNIFFEYLHCFRNVNQGHYTRVCDKHHDGVFA